MTSQYNYWYFIQNYFNQNLIDAFSNRCWIEIVKLILTGLNEGNPGGGIENGGIIGGNAMGGGRPAMFGGRPGTGGMATAGGIEGMVGGSPASIGGGSNGPAPMRPGELVPVVGGSWKRK